MLGSSSPTPMDVEVAEQERHGKQQPATCEASNQFQLRCEDFVRMDCSPEIVARLLALEQRKDDLALKFSEHSVHCTSAFLFVASPNVLEHENTGLADHTRYCAVRILDEDPKHSTARPRGNTPRV